MYLAAAGVGTLGVIDDDVVSLSNLQRQVIHTTPDVGAPKIESAAAAIARLNPHVAVKTHPVRLNAANALEIVRQYDVVAPIIPDDLRFDVLAGAVRRRVHMRAEANDGNLLVGIGGNRRVNVAVVVEMGVTNSHRLAHLTGEPHDIVSDAAHQTAYEGKK